MMSRFEKSDEIQVQNSRGFRVFSYKKSCLFARHKDVWGSGGTATLILNLSIRWTREHNL